MTGQSREEPLELEVKCLADRLADLEHVVNGLLELAGIATEEASVGSGLEASHRASIERLREKGKAAARRRFLGGQ